MLELTEILKALLAIELYDVTWDFGQLVWKDVVMVRNLGRSFLNLK